MTFRSTIWMPVRVMQVLRSGYGKYALDDAEKVSSNGQVFYQLELQARTRMDVHIVVNEDGQEAKGQTYWD
ncbi:MAG: hypothetical protein EOP49_30625 [Sphingobacteriales bacterium]|nr:MAG: hypothetical protein EOP49_30625 [Sphingobacteriales bacterium]